MSSQVITINVGGTLFTTTTTTLTTDPESMLARMISTEVPQARDSKGNLFLDRNPKTFEIILEYLRTGSLNDNGAGCTLQQLETEAEYFGLTRLLEAVNLKKSDMDDGIRRGGHSKECRKRIEELM